MVEIDPPQTATSHPKLGNHNPLGGDHPLETWGFQPQAQSPRGTPSLLSPPPLLSPDGLLGGPEDLRGGWLDFTGFEPVVQFGQCSRAA